MRQPSRPARRPLQLSITALLTLLTLAPTGCKNESRLSLADLVAREEQLRAEAEPVAVVETDLTLTEVKPYEVQPGDILAVQLIGLAADPYQATVLRARVHDDGTISLPAVGAIPVGGRDLGAVEQAIIDAHVPNIISDDSGLAVYVELIDRENTTVLVLGAAQQPGLVQLPTNERNPLYALAQVGGFTAVASGKVVLKPIRSDRPEICYNLRDINDVRRALTAPPLQSGDMLMVEGAQASAVYVTGLVNAPGAINVPPHSELSVLRAIATAGGVKPYLDVKEAVLVRRLDNGEQVQVDLELKDMLDGRLPDVAMRPGDVLHLPHTGDTLFQEWVLNNILVGPFSVGVRYDPLQQYNTERALENDNDSNSFSDAIRRSLSTTIPQAVVPPVNNP